MIRRILPLVGILAGAFVLAPSALAGQGIGACQLDGNADFVTPLTTTSVTTAYSFSGGLTNCTGSFSDKTGTVSAGKPITIGGIAYKPLDTPSLTGGCASSTTKGTAFVDWGAGKYSAISYSTTGAAAAVALQGTFKSGTATLTSVANDSLTGLPVSVIQVPLSYGGDYSGGPLAFQPASPTDCQTGVKSAGIHGAIGHGNYA